MKKIFIAIMLLSFNAYAATKPSNSITDSRVKFLTYQKNQVYPLQLHNRFEVTITLAPYERILADTLLFGTDKNAYIPVVIPGHENELIIRPEVENAPDTNLRFKTDAGRTYRFYIKKTHFKRRKIPKDLAFEIIFKYENQYLEATIRKQKREREALLELARQKNTYIKPTKIKKVKQCEKINFKNKNLDYLVEGDMSLRPQLIFDDGKFTYITFNNEIGTITALDENNVQSNVNFHVDCGMFIVHSVRPKLAITKNGRATCITNQAYKKEDN